MEMGVEAAMCQVLLLRNESDPPVSSSCTESNWTHLSVLVALKLIFFKAKYQTRGNGSRTRDLILEDLTTRLIVRLCF
jgi:hypothetical protein